MINNGIHYACKLSKYSSYNKTETRCSAIWGYDAQNPSDLSFAQDDIIISYPLKSGEQADWGYGMSELTGLKGFFPANYVEPVKDSSGKFKHIDIIKMAIDLDY